MQIVIDIPDYVYCDIQAYKTIFPDKIEEVAKAIKYGTPLPKGHGRLIDADDIDNHIVGGVDTRDCPTIIEADKAESEE